MRAFIIAMLMAITTLLTAQTGVANAGQSAKKHNAGPAQSQLKDLTHGVVTEGFFHKGQMDAIAQVIANRAYFYGDAKNLSKVVHNRKEMNGPVDKPTPWVGTEAKRFQKTKAYLAERYEALVSGTLIAPKYKTAWHFDRREHTDWGRFLGKECAPKGCVYIYEAKNKKVAKKLGARYKNADVFQTAQN